MIRPILALVAFVLAFNGEAKSTESRLACSTFISSYDNSAKGLFALGYLEGVHAALTKEIADILVPPSDKNHPMWWVLPTGDLSPKSLGQKISDACKLQPANDLVNAMLSIAARKEGWPAFGIWTDKDTGKMSKDAEKFKNVFKGNPATCKSYNELSTTIRQAILEGYFVATEAYRIAMKTPPEIPRMTWPLGVETITVRSILDEECANPKDANSTIRDILWVETIRLSVKKSPAKK